MDVLEIIVREREAMKGLRIKLCVWLNKVSENPLEDKLKDQLDEENEGRTITKARRKDFRQAGSVVLENKEDEDGELVLSCGWGFG